VTIIRQTEALDAGGVLLQRETPIGAEETAGDLEARLAFEGARALVDVLDALAAGTLAERPQDELAASYFGKLSKADGALDWTRGADALARRVRAMTPWPGAWFLRGDETIRVWRARALAGAAGDPSSDEPGAVLGGTREGVAVATGAGTLEILEIQPPGGRRMSAAAYGRGRPWIPGEPLGPR
jgi:methionyl-tRNA formyltransferase